MAADSPDDEKRGPRAGGDRSRRTGPLEGAFQEVLRRAVGMGFSSLFLTEEAIRRAFADYVPPEWADYVARQSHTLRGELIDRLVAEFGAWLRRTDPEQLQRALVQTLLENYDFTIEIGVSARRRPEAGGASLKLVPRRR